MRARLNSLIAIAMATGLVSASPASAQDIGLWGGWNDQGHGWQGSGPPGARDSYSYFDDQPDAFPRIMDGGGRPLIEPIAPRIVYFPEQGTRRHHSHRYRGPAIVLRAEF